jgi:hypothetical protein
MSQFLTDLKNSIKGLNKNQKLVAGVVAAVFALLIAGLVLFSLDSGPAKTFSDKNEGVVLANNTGYKGNRFFSEYINFVAPASKPDIKFESVGQYGENIVFEEKSQAFSILVYPRSYFQIRELINLKNSKKAPRRGWFYNFSGNKKTLAYLNAVGVSGPYIIQIQAVSEKDFKNTLANLNRIIKTTLANKNGSP